MTDVERRVLDIERLRGLAERATPQRIDTAETVEKNGHMDCPWCDGQGEVSVDTYTNYDDCAIGVQFFGIGHEHVDAENYFRAVKPAVITGLLDTITEAHGKIAVLASMLGDLLSVTDGDGPTTADDPDEDSVGWDNDGPLPMTFGHIRRAQRALADLLAAARSLLEERDAALNRALVAENCNRLLLDESRECVRELTRRRERAEAAEARVVALEKLAQHWESGFNKCAKSVEDIAKILGPERFAALRIPSGEGESV